MNRSAIVASVSTAYLSSCGNDKARSEKRWCTFVVELGEPAYIYIYADVCAIRDDHRVGSPVYSYPFSRESPTTDTRSRSWNLACKECRMHASTRSSSIHANHAKPPYANLLCVTRYRNRRAAPRRAALLRAVVLLYIYIQLV